MYIQDIIGDKAPLLEAAMRHPGLAPKRKPTIEVAMKCVISEVERVCMTSVAKDYTEKLNDVYLSYTLMNGERDEIDVASLGDWDEGLDNAVEALFEPITELLSANWLGEKTIDTRLHEDGAIAKLATSAGKEIFKTLTHGKEPGQILSNAGILRTDVEVYFDMHMNPTPELEEAMKVENENTIALIVGAMQQHLGAEFDQMEVYDDIGMLFDDDEILADAAAARLGLSSADREAVQVAAFEGLDTDGLFAMLNEAPAPVAETPKKAPPVKETSTDGKPRRNKKAEAEQKAQAKAEGTIPAEVLQAYKAHGGMGDTEFAAKLGVSRGTYNNYLAGKSPFVPDDAQRETLRNQIVGDINGLLDALGTIDAFAYDPYQ